MPYPILFIIGLLVYIGIIKLINFIVNKGNDI